MTPISPVSPIGRANYHPTHRSAGEWHLADINHTGLAREPNVDTQQKTHTKLRRITCTWHISIVITRCSATCLHVTEIGFNLWFAFFCKPSTGLIPSTPTPHGSLRLAKVYCKCISWTRDHQVHRSFAARGSGQPFRAGDFGFKLMNLVCLRPPQKTKPRGIGCPPEMGNWLADGLNPGDVWQIWQIVSKIYLDSERERKNRHSTSSPQPVGVGLVFWWNDGPQSGLAAAASAGSEHHYRFGGGEHILWVCLVLQAAVLATISQKPKFEIGNHVIDALRFLGFARICNGKVGDTFNYRLIDRMKIYGFGSPKWNSAFLLTFPLMVCSFISFDEAFNCFPLKIEYSRQCLLFIIRSFKKQAVLSDFCPTKNKLFLNYFAYSLLF